MKFIKKTDLLLIFSLLVISIFLVLIQKDKSKTSKDVLAEVYYYKKHLQTIELSKAKNTTLNYPEAPEVFLEITEKGEIYFAHSDCPDKVCIHAGKLSVVGQSAACLPNGILVKITQSNREVDSLDIIIQ